MWTTAGKQDDSREDQGRPLVKDSALKYRGRRESWKAKTAQFTKLNSRLHAGEHVYLCIVLQIL